MSKLQETVGQACIVPGIWRLERCLADVTSRLSTAAPATRCDPTTVDLSAATFSLLCANLRLTSGVLWRTFRGLGFGVTAVPKTLAPKRFALN